MMADVNEEKLIRAIQLARKHGDTALEVQASKKLLQIRSGQSQAQKAENQPVLHPDVPGVESIPSEQPSYLERVGQNLGNEAAGLVRGAASLGSTLLWPVDAATDYIVGDRGKNVAGLVSGNQPISRHEERVQALDESLKSLGADPSSGLFKTGKVLSEIGGTAPIGGIIAKPVAYAAKSAPTLAQFLTPLAEAISTSGTTAGTLAKGAGIGAKAADLGTRVLGGAITGGVGTGLVDPEGAATGAVIGGVLPIVSKTIGAGVDLLRRNPELEAAIKNRTIEAAGFRKVGERFVSDSAQNELLKNGIDQKTVVELAQSTGTQQKKYLEMLGKVKSRLRGESGAVGDPSEVVIGDSIMERYMPVAKDLVKQGKLINKYVEDDLSKKTVDIIPELDNFVSQLESYGAKIDGNKIEFTDSAIVSPTTQNKVKNILKREVFREGGGDGKDVHLAKRAIQKLADFSSAVEGTKDAEVEGLIRQLQYGINQKLGQISKGYAEANANYSKSKDAISAVARDLNRNRPIDFDAYDGIIEKSVGDAARKVITNYGSSTDVYSAIKQLDERAKELGGSYDDDIIGLVDFNNALRKIGPVKGGTLPDAVQIGAVAAASAKLGPAAPVASAAGKSLLSRFKTPKEATAQVELLDKMIKVATDKNRGVK
jgi:hypothetical protein